MKALLIQPLPEVIGVGRGTAVFVHGRNETDGEDIRALRVTLGEDRPGTEARRAGAEWWATVTLDPITERRRADVRLVAELHSGEQQSADLGEVELAPDSASDGAEEPAPDVWPGRAEERTAICMGTHDPPLDLFRRQVESIREQTHPEWICVISDDASKRESLRAIREIIGGDGRFVLRPSEKRLGFYANFERALRLSPPNATHVSLSDHDDRWHADRLRTLLAALGDRDTLAYSDMRIVSQAGEVISETYWRFRRNNWTDLATLLIGNTITGAASLFRRSVLDRALPFPPPVGNAFHDHWLALTALASGKVSYVDRPLHDYVQHPGAVIGFSSANADRGENGIRGLTSRGRRLADRLLRPEGRRRYFEDYCRIALLATVLKLRCGEVMTPEKLAAVDRIRTLDDSARAAAGLAVRALSPGNETMGVDRSVLAGLAWSRLARRRS